MVTLDPRSNTAALSPASAVASDCRTSPALSPQWTRRAEATTSTGSPARSVPARSHMSHSSARDRQHVLDGLRNGSPSSGRHRDVPVHASSSPRPTRPIAGRVEARSAETRTTGTSSPGTRTRTSAPDLQLDQVEQLRVVTASACSSPPQVRHAYPRASSTCSRVCGIAPSSAETTRIARPPVPRRDHVLHEVGVAGMSKWA